MPKGVHKSWFCSHLHWLRWARCVIWWHFFRVVGCRCCIGFRSASTIHSLLYQSHNCVVKKKTLQTAKWFGEEKKNISQENTYSVDDFASVATVASVVVVVDDDVAGVVVDVVSSSCFTTFFTITTINFFSSTLYDAMVLSSANIIPAICQTNKNFDLYVSQLQVQQNGIEVMFTWQHKSYVAYLHRWVFGYRLDNLSHVRLQSFLLTLSPANWYISGISISI